MWVAYKMQYTCGWWAIFSPIEVADRTKATESESQTDIKFEELIVRDAKEVCQLCRTEGRPHNLVKKERLLEAKWKAGQIPFLQLDTKT